MSKKDRLVLGGFMLFSVSLGLIIGQIEWIDLVYGAFLTGKIDLFLEMENIKL